MRNGELWFHAETNSCAATTPGADNARATDNQIAVRVPFIWPRRTVFGSSTRALSRSTSAHPTLRRHSHEIFFHFLLPTKQLHDDDDLETDDNGGLPVSIKMATAF